MLVLSPGMGNPQEFSEMEPLWWYTSQNLQRWSGSHWEHTKKEAGVTAPIPPSMHLLTMGPQLQTPLHIPLVVAWTTLQPPRLSPCSQPKFPLQVCPPKPKPQHPAPAHQQMHLRLGTAARLPGPSVQLSLFSAHCKTVSTLFSKPLNSPCVLANLPASERVTQSEGTHPPSYLPPRAQIPSQLPSLFSFTTPRPCWPPSHPSYNFSFMSSSASFQQVFHENCPTHRCIFDVLVRGDELRVLLSHRLDLVKTFSL